ncbi:hypothetical protein [Persicobacter diffluens]|uniref:Uncharacterized protein n=1 Tax=Persicobacter diffluens TaxID=981 RepID=A0AAN4VUL6_9BACT|nr:hypothetical protein PEDI_05750 [Persicobacter diffluens]
MTKHPLLGTGLMLLLLMLTFLPGQLFGQANNTLSLTDRKGQKIYPIIYNRYKELREEYPTVSSPRIQALKEMAFYFRSQQKAGKPARFIFYADQNAQTIQFTMAWATVAAFYYGVNKVSFYAVSGSGEAIQANTIKALEKMGFIAYNDEYGRLQFQLHYGYQQQPLKMKSYRPQEKGTPLEDYCTVIVDASSPLLKGSDLTVYLPYNEFGELDDFALNKQISLEMFYLFKHLRD